MLGLRLAKCILVYREVDSWLETQAAVAHGLYMSHNDANIGNSTSTLDRLREKVASLEHEDEIEFHEMTMLWKQYGPGVETLYLVATALFYCLLTCLWVHFRTNIETLCERI